MHISYIGKEGVEPLVICVCLLECYIGERVRERERDNKTARQQNSRSSIQNHHHQELFNTCQPRVFVYHQKAGGSALKRTKILLLILFFWIIGLTSIVCVCFCLFSSLQLFNIYKSKSQNAKERKTDKKSLFLFFTNSSFHSTLPVRCTKGRMKAQNEHVPHYRYHTIICPNFISFTDYFFEGSM